jgi:thioredoxin-related protein
MKNLIYFLTVMLFTISCVSENAEKKEITFINDAVNKAKTANKILIIEFWAPECGPCIRLKREIFENGKNREFLDKNFLLVQVSPIDSVYKSL